MNLKIIFLLLMIVSLTACSVTMAEKNNPPSWMHIDARLKTVSFNLVSGWNGNNNAYNYNGFYAGSVTLKVPDG